MFRKNMQMACDSLAYSDLDSLMRLYKEPIVYNEGNKQYVADSIYLAIKDREVEKAHLLDNAFITIQEAKDAFDQIKSVEMVAYFDTERSLKRFDALGGASSLFYLAEGDALATVNKVESKMIYATFTEGEIDHIYYFDNPKNDGYPTVQLPKEDKELKGFRWDPEKQPKSPEDVTSLKPRKSERIEYLNHNHVKFDQTDIYFPGYIDKLYQEITRRDSIAVAREQQRKAAADSLERLSLETDALADSLMTLPVPDSLRIAADSLKMATDSLGMAADSLALAGQLADSTGLASPLSPADSLSATEPSVDVPLTPEELKAQEKARREAEKAAKKAERERIKAEKQAAREARWAEEDRIYEEKQAAKAQKKLERQRARKLKQLQRLERKAQKERRILEKYLEKERLRKAKEQSKTIETE